MKENSYTPNLGQLFDELVTTNPQQRAQRLKEIEALQPTIAYQLKALLEADQQIADHTAKPIVNLETSDETDLQGQSIGPWRLTGILGQGGMGTVYQGERSDGRVQQKVAIKILRREKLGLDGLKRFLNERQILASLEHPQITRLIDTGELQDGTPYVVMEHVDGLPMVPYCDDNQLDLRQRLDLFLKVCSAVSYAHRHLIVHRDIKAGNILVNANGEPKLLDFGIAKPIGPTAHPDAHQTADHQRVFSPYTAAPEQILGAQITVACDVYALGILLHELLVGVPPFDLAGKSPLELEHAILREIPPPPSKRAYQLPKDEQTSILAVRHQPSVKSLSRALRGDFDAIVAKCLAKDSEARYATVQQLSDDLRAHQQNRPVLARRGRGWENLIKFIRRNKAAVAGSAILVVTVIAATLTIWSQSQQTAQQRDRAQAIRDFLIEVFQSAGPDHGLGVNAKVLDVLNLRVKGLEEKFSDNPRIKAELYEVIGNIYSSLGQNEAAIHYYDQSLDLIDPSNDANHPMIYRAQLNLADSHALRGELQKANAHLEQARVYVSSIEQMVLIALTQGTIYTQSGEHNQMLSLYRENVDKYAEVLPRGNSVRLKLLRQYYRNLGLLHGFTDDILSQTKALAEEARTYYEVKHPNYIQIMRNVSETLHYLGKHEEMLTNTETVLLLTEEVYGKESHTYAWALSQKALALRGVGRILEGFRVSEQSLAIQKGVLGAPNSDLAKIHFNLATTAMEIDELKQHAYEHFDKALTLGDQAWQGWHFNKVFFRMAYGYFLNTERKFSLAVHPLREAAKAINSREEEKHYDSYPEVNFFLAVAEYALEKNQENIDAVKYWGSEVSKFSGDPIQRLNVHIEILAELGYQLDVDTNLDTTPQE